MIISFSIDNWMSFRDRATFSMLATRERQHGERLALLPKFNSRLLPISAIYGGNASGKTNLFKALCFAKTLVVKGTQPDSHLGVESFRLGSAGPEGASRFEFQLLIDELIYGFDFVLNRREVLHEQLRVATSSSEKTLYTRTGREMEFHPSLKNDAFLQFAFKGTRDNQLFLTNSVSQKVDNFRPVYDWFKDKLELVAPDSRFEPYEQFLDEAHPLYATMNAMLQQLDTGITHLGGEDLSIDNLPFPEAIKMKIQEDVKEGMTVRLMSNQNDRYVLSRKGGELMAKKLVAFHANADGAEVKFEIRQESDGSQRVIDLLPAFLQLSAPGSQKVVVIDEVDRSLHTLLTQQLLQSYLRSCSSLSRAQLLLTTHDVLLMDQDFLRRDEMWVAQRNSEGVSCLVPFSDFKDVRYDKDIRKSYLQGRLGGIPFFSSPIELAQGEVSSETVEV